MANCSAATTGAVRPRRASDLFTSPPRACAADFLRNSNGSLTSVACSWAGQRPMVGACNTMSITATGEPGAEPSGRLIPADDPIGGHDAYVVDLVTRELSRGPAASSILLGAHVRTAAGGRGRGAARSSGRPVRRECGAKRSPRGVLRTHVLGDRVRDGRGRGRVCVARAGRPGSGGGPPRACERLGADGKPPA